MHRTLLLPAVSNPSPTPLPPLSHVITIINNMLTLILNLHPNLALTLALTNPPKLIFNLTYPNPYSNLMFVHFNRSDQLFDTWISIRQAFTRQPSGASNAPFLPSPFCSSSFFPSISFPHPLTVNQMLDSLFFHAYSPFSTSMLP